MTNTKNILLTWDAFNNGFVVTAKAVELLEKEQSIKIDEVIYLQHQKLQESNLAEIDVFYERIKLRDALKLFSEEKIQKRLRECYDLQDKMKNAGKLPEFSNKNINIEGVTNYQSIYNKLIEFIKQEFEKRENFKLHINVSPGTPQMHVVWLMLNSTGFLPPETTLWSTQWKKEKQTTILEKVDFKPKTFLSEILKSKYLKKYQPAINPNETVSSKRQAAEERIRLFSHIPNAPILLLGERGTGKSTYARTLIKDYQDDAELPFEELACGTFSEELMRSELFGHIKGAFTGAEKDKDGILAKFKKGGILFLDEIHDLSKPLQRQLMQVLQTGKYYPVGNSKAHDANFRLITASNLSYSALAKRLDSDFMDRIARLVIEIPPLRESRDDIRNYWQKAWREVADFETAPTVIWNKKLQNFLNSNELNGNFRDLQKIAAYIIAYYFNTKNKEKAVTLAIKEFKKWANKQLTEDEDTYFIRNKTHEEIIAYFERDLVKWAIEEYGSKKAAAKILGRSEDMLNKYLKLNRLNRNKDVKNS